MINDKIQRLENMLSKYFGVAAEITIRGERSFTVSFEGENEKAALRIKSYLASATQSVSHIYDKECDLTAIYFNA